MKSDSQWLQISFGSFYVAIILQRAIIYNLLLYSAGVYSTLQIFCKMETTIVHSFGKSFVTSHIKLQITLCLRYDWLLLTL